MQVAQTILEQLGGNKFCAMVGAKNLVSLGDGLQFKIGAGAKRGINRIKIKLTADDLYIVTFYAGSVMNLREVATVEGLYADALASTFTEHTGFDTRL